MKHYLIPTRDMVAKRGIVAGLGVKEILVIIAGGAIGYALQLIPVALPQTTAQQIFARAFLFVLPLGTAYMLVRPGFFGEQNMLQMLKAYCRWASRPKIYHYVGGG